MVVEEIAEGVKNLTVTGDAAASGGEGQRRGGGGSSNRIQVSNTKKPLFFYVNLAKRYMQQHGDVELSALGMAIATVVTVAEILKNNGFAVEKKIRTSTVEINDESRGRPFQKAKKRGAKWKMVKSRLENSTDDKLLLLCSVSVV
ncbi:Alba DNA/RNA-binding protein [Zea mays]|uniref:Alba DNA/RNA-binding protein n=1 Tax=Zea mays TaxID=4577 RepID=A0A1D6MK41_MAIZE|nr:Alba DNA/RNA-binding protein [Zea mays]